MRVCLRAAVLCEGMHLLDEATKSLFVSVLFQMSI